MNCDLLVMAVSTWRPGGTPTSEAAYISDSKGNAWTALDPETANTQSQLFYCLSPIVGTGHTFSYDNTSATTFPAIGILGFSDVLGFDSSSGSSNGSTTSIQPGALTPGDDNSLLITAVSFYPSGLPTVSSPFGRLIATDYVASSHIGIGVARVVDMAATSRNPTWSRATAMDTGCTMAVFSPDHDLSRPVSGGIIWGGSAGKSVSRVVTASGGISGVGVLRHLSPMSNKYQAEYFGLALPHLRLHL